MKIISIEESNSEIIETDKNEFPTYRRFSGGQWENLMGESLETIYSEGVTENNLEKLYFDFKSKNFITNKEIQNNIDLRIHMLTLIEENEDLKAKLNDSDLLIVNDAKRYRWLKIQKKLTLHSSNMQWINEDGTKFNSSHRLCAGGTSYAEYETLDETIDNAIKLKDNQ